MRGRYSYFCSGGSIFTIPPVGRRGRRMGKYMKKAKGVKSMEVSQSTLLGVRTRARALALQKQINENTATIGKPCKSSESHRIPLKNEHQYMQLRSRRLEKVARHYVIQKRCTGERPNERKMEFGGGGNVGQVPSPTLPFRSRSCVELCLPNDELLDVPARNSCSGRPEFGCVGVSATAHNFDDASPTRVISPALEQIPVPMLPFNGRPYVELRLHNKELLDMLARNSCSSRPEFHLVGASATAPDFDDTSHSRVTSPAQSALQTSNLVGPSAISAPMLTIQQRGASQVVTRNHQQELDRKSSMHVEVMEMDFERDTPEATSPLGNVQRVIEIGSCSGESPVIAGPSGTERQQGPNTRSQKQECTPVNFSNTGEIPGLTSIKGETMQMRSFSAPPFSQSTEAPFSAEIEAFFASAEQSERRRFIDRYNFDPLTEKPLKGRYLWLKE